jgi:putative phosphoesterase
MLFAVASDIHDNLAGWRALWHRLAAAKPDALILCGDLSRPATLEAMAPELPWAFCLGNCDNAEARQLVRSGRALQATVWGDEGLWALPEGGTIAFTHFPARAKVLAASGAHKAVFYGHSHRPASEQLGACLLANPGDVEGRYGRVGGLLWDSISGRLDWVEA